MPFAQQAHPTRMVARLSERARSSPTRISSNTVAHENPLSDSDHTPSETRDLSNQVSLVLEPKATSTVPTGFSILQHSHVANLFLGLVCPWFNSLSAGHSGAGTQKTFGHIPSI